MQDRRRLATRVSAKRWRVTINNYSNEEMEAVRKNGKFMQFNNIQ